MAEVVDRYALHMDGYLGDARYTCITSIASWGKRGIAD